MFTGDMLLYYEPVSGLDYDSVVRMSAMPISRLIAGGLIGLIASIFSMVSAYIFYIVFRPVSKVLATILFVSLAIEFIISGTYHAMFSNFGFVGRLSESLQTQQISFIRTYLNSIYSLIFICATIWTLLFVYLIIFKKSILPVWILFFTPTLLILLAGTIKNHIPYPFGAIIYGGWINLCFMLFFIVCLILFSKKSIKSKMKYIEVKN